MKKIILSLAACLLCLLMSVSVSMAEEHNVQGEWYMITMSDDVCDMMDLTASERVMKNSSYGVHSLYDSETNKLSGLMIDHEGIPLYAGSVYCSEHRFLVALLLSIQPDGKTYVFFSGDVDADGNPADPANAPVYMAPAETMLITPTHMLFNGSRIEYYMFGDRLFTIDGNGYAKAPLEWMNEDVFIARPQDGSDALLFVRTKN